MPAGTMGGEDQTGGSGRQGEDEGTTVRVDGGDAARSDPGRLQLVSIRVDGRHQHFHC